MNTQNIIYQKMESFIKKFYMNELIRGIILFVGFGLLYFLFTLFIEYFLWLKPIGRTFLFWAFVMVEVFLLFRFILFPIFKLFRLQKGMSYQEASLIIGNHFTEVKDKLTNFIQLSENKEQSELLVASIEQKALALQPIPFGNVINFNRNKKYLPLAVIPILFFVFFYLTGNSKIISQSFNRVVHFNASFLPPAPFQFVVLNSNLQTEQNKDFVVRVKTIGKIVPENAMIFLGDESYYMEAVKAGEFEFKVVKPSENISFHIEANEVVSPDLELKVVTVPAISNFEMRLDFPSYLNKKSELIKGSGNAIIPEGTRVTWKINAAATQNIDWKADKSYFPFIKTESHFVLSKNILQNTDYQILTSNEKVKNYEKLNYQLSVVKDQFPTINVRPVPDSLKAEKNYVVGQISDDYGLSKLQVVYYERANPSKVKRGTITCKKETFDQFVFAFPSNLPVVPGVSYEYYFEIFDNDAIHHFKSTKSSVFSNRISTEEEKADQLLQQQNDNINSLEKSLQSQDKQLSEMDKLQNIGKEKDSFEFKEQQKVNDFIKRQMQQDEMMQQFAKKMKDNLDKFNTDKKEESKEDLQKRLDKVDKDLVKNQKLLEELQKLNDKINSEDLLKKLDNFKQNSKNQTRTLEQLVELTKKFYVEKKAEQISDKLDKLSKKQNELSDKEKDNNVKSQDEINTSFDKIQEDLKTLEDENKELKSPLDLPKDVLKEKSIDDDLKKATDELKKSNTDKAKPKQKSASKKMKEISMKMQESMESSEMEQMEEDVKMLRQILDNLLAFSLSQEDVMGQFKNLKSGSPSFNKNIKIQQNLKLQFKHVDDSLFALSLRNPKIEESITKEIGNIQYNMDKSLETLTDSQISKGLSHQQYTVSSANKLADVLSDILSNMQMSLSRMAMGKPKPGQGQGMQLPDIIKKQDGLAQKMKDGLKKGDGSDQGDSDKKGNKEGGSGSNGTEGEGEAEAIMQIYKQQKQLRDALEMELNKQGLSRDGQSALDQMKQIEKQLLNKGFKNETLQKILNLQQELLKLKTAIQQQGEENKRQSETNKKEFNNESNALPSSILDYLNSIEILNRQSLPLRSNFNFKVQEYFNKK